MSQAVLLAPIDLGLFRNRSRNAEDESCLKWPDLFASTENLVRVSAARAKVAEFGYDLHAVIVTTNIDRFTRYVDAHWWHDIPPD
ncbi:MAG: hypothetical protein IT427_12285 [Pirellulales bacterium]|nr:hypothetical protein [Pirellulales bacterium]